MEKVDSLNHSEQTNIPSVTPVAKTLEHNGITWIDVENPTRQDLEDIAREHNLHALQIEEYFAKSQLSQIEIEKEYIFALLHFPTYSSEQETIGASQMGVFLGKNQLITVHNELGHEVREVFEACEKDIEHRKTYMQKSSGYLLYKVTGDLLGDVIAIASSIDRDLDAIEDNVFDNEASDAHQIESLRRKILHTRRIVAPLKEVLNDLSTSIDVFTGENLTRYYTSNTRTAKKLWVALEEAQETIEIYKDADFTISTERTNEILAILTIIFTFGIPATVIGAFYGMNIPLPGGIETGAWTFFGTYTTLILIIIASTLPALGMYWYFKKKKWL